MSLPLSVLFCLFHCFLLAKTIKFARYLVQFLACSHYICSGIDNQFILVVQEAQHFAVFFHTITHLDGT